MSMKGHKSIITGLPTVAAAEALARIPARPVTKVKEITPLYDRCLVRPLSEGGQTKSGLFVPEVAKKNAPYARGEVIAVGVGRVTFEGKQAPMLVKVGDLVLYDRKAGTFLPLGDEEVVMLREPEILATITVEEESSIITLEGGAS
jgi:chaperonin GroES